MALWIDVGDGTTTTARVGGDPCTYSWCGNSATTVRKVTVNNAILNTTLASMRDASQQETVSFDPYPCCVHELMGFSSAKSDAEMLTLAASLHAKWNT